MCAGHDLLPVLTASTYIQFTIHAEPRVLRYTWLTSRSTEQYDETSVIHCRPPSEDVQSRLKWGAI